MKVKRIEVTSEALRFISKSGEEIIENFKECNENWIAYNMGNTWSEEESIQSICVGQRDVCAKPLYFEFFTKTVYKSGTKKSERILELQKLIHNVGWSTFDLS
jgi:hypothetical protein